MIQINDKKKCSGCEACTNICPKNCIEMKLDEHGFRYPNVNQYKCVNCHLCENVCPMNRVKPKESFSPKVFAVQNKNNDIRKESSSGGVFTLLAEEIINQNGIVFGAVLNEYLEVEHLSVSEKEHIAALRGSKYLQSHIKDSYKQVRNDLHSGQMVLFSGTGCQIAGLKSFLGKEYSNLLTVEVVCHGVPSEMIFKQYIEDMETKLQQKVKSINFRNKNQGWSNYHVSITLNDDSTLSGKAMENDFMKGYIWNLYLRPSCKDCPFKCMNSGSDILLGDFWGINELGSLWNDDQGTSAVFVNTNNGENLLDTVKEKTIIQEVDVNMATRFNPCIIRPVEKSNDIYAELSNDTFHHIIEKHRPEQPSLTLSQKIKNRLKKVIRR